ncbi:MAG: DUF4890 domain-containing protein [Bacteroides sp.]|jgi:hypothetical protein|nr:DUF4890 domain-containing protein [Bacteroides sp.]MCI1682775.1 DUF4890 domain-containing protein [Bacteroides sp.]
MKTKLNGNLVLMMMLFVSMVFATQSFAQGRGGMRTPEERAKMLTEKIKEALSLNETQEKTVYDINLKYAKQNQEVMTSDGDRAEKMEKMRSLQDAKNGELKKVLTEDQYKKYEKMLEEMRPQGRRGSGRNR